MKSAAIMQPTYMPWIGYFAMMDMVDSFIILDSVQFAKRSWQQRNKIRTAQDSIWLTVPVLSKGRRDQLISEVVIDNEKKFPASHIGLIREHYKKAPYFEKYFETISDIIQVNSDSLLKLNCGLIDYFSKILEIETDILYSSEIPSEGSKADRLASICEHLQIKQYISPQGSRDYLGESHAFELKGIAVNYFEYTHPEYPQLHKPFEPYMSILDLIFNCGDDSRRILLSGLAA